MCGFLFVKRIFFNKVYWLSVLITVLLLMCSVVEKDAFTGKEYMFFEIFFNGAAGTALENESISFKQILLGYDTSYLWMFCPIVVGISCVLVRKTERFVMVRTNKNRYLIAKFSANILASGMILLISYFVFAVICSMMEQGVFWDEYIIKKLLSVFFWGIYSAIPSIILSEWMENKYLILCVPFVWNYFVCMFLGNIVPHRIGIYILPYYYQSVLLSDKNTMIITITFLLLLVLACLLIKKAVLERRCDCGYN